MCRAPLSVARRRVVVDRGVRTVGGSIELLGRRKGKRVVSGFCAVQLINCIIKKDFNGMRRLDARAFGCLLF